MRLYKAECDAAADSLFGMKGRLDESRLMRREDVAAERRKTDEATRRASRAEEALSGRMPTWKAMGIGGGIGIALGIGLHILLRSIASDEEPQR